MMDPTLIQFYKFISAGPCRMSDAKNMIKDGAIKADVKYLVPLSPLSFVVERGHLELAQLLLDRGADPNYGGRSGKFPLYLAAKTQGEEGDKIMKLLLEKGADVNMQFMNGNHAFLEAVRQKELSKVQILLEAGADINVCNNGGDAAIHVAAIQGNLIMARELIKAGSIIQNSLLSSHKWKRFTSSGLSPLHYTAFGVQGGHPKMAELLIQYGANVDMKIPENGRTALHFCAIRNSTSTAKVLISHGCLLNPVSTENNELKTPLHKAIDCNDVDMSVQLIESGADLDITCQHNMTPLMLILTSHLSNKTVLCQHLLQGGCDVNLKTRSSSHFEVAVQLDLDEGISNHLPYSVMLILAGYNLDEKELQLARGFFSAKDSFQYICDTLEVPRTLQQIARLTIRKLLCTVSSSKVDRLNLPSKLKDFVSLQDIF